MEALKGKNQILLFRLLEEATKKTGAKLAFQTEHSVEKSRDSDTTETKDGPITIGQGIEESIPFSCIMAKDDPVVDLLDIAINENKIVELWEVDITKENQGKFPAIYRQGLITELNKTANTEDLIELEGTFITNGIAQKGEVELTKEQQEVVQYKFKDLSVEAGV